MRNPSLKASAKSHVKTDLGLWDQFGKAFTKRKVGTAMVAAGIGIGVMEMHFGIKVGAGMWAFIGSVPFYLYHRKKRLSLTIHLPLSSGIKHDPNNRQPKHKGNPMGIGKAEGVVYYGNDIDTNEEVWVSDSVNRQHQIFLGTTGSGKTVGQSTISTSYLIMGSGYSITDGKADLKLPIEHMSKAWRMNLIDNVQVINYIRGEQDSWNKDPHGMKDSNSYHPYMSSSSDTLSEITKALLDGDGDIWAKRAESYVPAMIKPNVFRRDKQNLLLTIDVLSDMLILEEAGKVLGDETIPDQAKSQLLKFIKTLPGMNEKALKTIMEGQSPSGREAATILDQFGYVVMQIIPIMNMLAGDYGFIFNSADCPTGNIDMEDVVLNRRLLLILLPALETSPSSLASLGRITLAAQKSMMAKSLGDKLAGEASKNTEARPTTSPTAFLSDNDEVGYYLTEGTAVAAAQARSIGFALQYCAQDLSAMRRLSDQVAKEVDSIWGNTNLKMFGRVLDNATTDEIIKYVGEDYFARIDRYDINEAGMSRSLKAAGYSVSKENILDVKDLQNLVEGEVYFHYNGKLALVRIPMLSTQELEYVRLNDYFSLSNTSSGEPVSMGDYNRFMKHAARFIKDEEIEFTETNHSLPNSLQQSAHLVEKFAGDIRMGTSYIAGTQMKLDLDLLHYHHEDATSDFDEDFEHEFDDVSPGPDPQEATGPEQLSTEEYGFDTDEDGMPFANVAFEEKADSSTPVEDITGDDLAFTDSISVESESNSDESTGHVIAEEVASQTQNIFDTVFGVQGRDIVESSMAELSDVITGDSDGRQVAKDVVENVSRTVTHPNPPTLAKNPRKTKEQLRALINVYSSEIAEDDI